MNEQTAPKKKPAKAAGGNPAQPLNGSAAPSPTHGGDSPVEDGQARRRAVRSRNIAVGLGLVALCLIIYLVSFVRVGGA